MLKRPKRQAQQKINCSFQNSRHLKINSYENVMKITLFQKNLFENEKLPKIFPNFSSTLLFTFDVIARGC